MMVIVNVKKEKIKYSCFLFFNNELLFREIVLPLSSFLSKVSKLKEDVASKQTNYYNSCFGTF